MPYLNDNNEIKKQSIRLLSLGAVLEHVLYATDLTCVLQGTLEVATGKSGGCAGPLRLQSNGNTVNMADGNTVNMADLRASLKPC
jgi:hypothetical protein